MATDACCVSMEKYKQPCLRRRGYFNNDFSIIHCTNFTSEVKKYCHSQTNEY